MTDLDLDLAAVPTGPTVTLRRSFEGELELREAEGGAPEVVGRIVPFGQVTEVADVVDGALRRYRERFLPGCTVKVRQDAARFGGPRWVTLKLDHVETFDEKIGFARSIEERDDGVWGTFELYRDAHLDKVRSMLRTSHTGLSVEFADHRPPVVEDGIVGRRQIILRGVAATPTPCYLGAMIASVRAEDLAGAVDMGTPNLDRLDALLADLGPRP